MSNVSHGRGGAGNIRPDSEAYTDGGIVREGPMGDQGDGPYSTGRGGVGNVGSPHTKATTNPGDEEVVPEVSLRDDKGKDVHVGRGGAGNEYHTGPKDTEKKESLIDKVKHKVLHKDSH